MPKFTLEQGESDEGLCECCGKTTKTIWGFIHRNNKCRAVYYVSWTMEHREQGATFLVCMGDWEAEEPADRQSFALRLKMMPSGAAFMVVDAVKTQWAKKDAEQNETAEGETPQKDILGVMLDRETALASPLKTDVFAIADLILDQDKRIKPFLKPPALPPFLKPRSVMKPLRNNNKWN